MMQLNSQFQKTQTQGVSVESIIGNSDVTNFALMAEIGKELLDNPYDMISLVFLLYDVPDIALQRLIEFQRVSNNAATSTNFNMLHEWFRHAKHNVNWKHELVEALLLCQLHSIVRKLGINVPATRRYYQTDSITVKMYVNPMKKALYKLCESINSDNLLKLKKALLELNIDTTEYDSCELVFLKLMRDKFIAINQYQYNKKGLGLKIDVEKLIKIVKGLPGLRKLVLEIDILQETLNETPNTVTTVTNSFSEGASSEHEIVDESRRRQESMNGVSKPGIMVTTSVSSERKIVHETRKKKESMNDDVSKPGITLTASAPTERVIVNEPRQGKESLNDVFKFGITITASTSSENIRVDELRKEQADKMYATDLEEAMGELCDLPDQIEFIEDELDSDAAVNKTPKLLEV